MGPSIKKIRPSCFGITRAQSIRSKGSKREMVALVMIAILALLGFLCVSHAIPGIAQPPPNPRLRPRRDRARRPQKGTRVSGPTPERARVKLLVQKS